MTERNRSGSRGRTAARVRATAAVLATAACLGCAPRGVLLPTQQERQLEGRAVDLLVRATQHDADVVCANAMEALARVAPDSGKPGFRAALDSPQPLVRYAACVAIGDCRDRTALAAVRRRLEDSDQRVRLGAAYALCRCGELAWGGPLLANTLRDHPDEKMRAEAAYLIGKLGDKQATTRLKTAHKREPSGYAVVHIETALALLGDDAMADRLIQYILKSDNVTRLLALQALIELADPRARRALLYRLNDKSDHLETRLLAARALGRLGDPAGYNLALDSLTHSAADNNDQMRVRVNAALALGAIQERRSLASLQQLAESDADERVQVAACLAILEILRGVEPAR